MNLPHPPRASCFYASRGFCAHTTTCGRYEWIDLVRISLRNLARNTCISSRGRSRTVLHM